MVFYVVECPKRYWGPNCVNLCECGIGAEKCDPVKGCQCSAGYEGGTCTNDIDECSRNLGICQSNEICANTIGSYSCQCLPGYSKVEGTCESKIY